MFLRILYINALCCIVLVVSTVSSLTYKWFLTGMVPCYMDENQMTEVNVFDILIYCSKFTPWVPQMATLPVMVINDVNLTSSETGKIIGGCH